MTSIDAPEALGWTEIEPLMKELKDVARHALRRVHGEAPSTTELLDTSLRRMFQNDGKWDYQKVWQNRAHVFGSFRRAVRNALTDRHRKHQARKRGPTLSMPDLTEPAGRILSNPELYLDFERCLDQLEAISEREAAVIELCKVWEFELREAAAILEIPETEARKLVNSALKHFRELLNHG